MSDIGVLPWRRESRASIRQVGESTENPFEGSANDVPITRLCQDVEDDLRALLGEGGQRRLARVQADISS